MAGPRLFKLQFQINGGGRTTAGRSETLVVAQPRQWVPLQRSSTQLTRDDRMVGRLTDLLALHSVFNIQCYFLSPSRIHRSSCGTLRRTPPTLLFLYK